MFKLKMFVMPNGERIRNTVKECKGDVFLVMPDKTVCNLKKDQATVHTSSLFPNSHDTYNLMYDNEEDSEHLFSLLY